MRKPILTNANKLDHLGVAASCICALHCAMAPILVAALPFLGVSFLAEEQTEWTLLLVSVAVGLFSLVPAYIGRHKRYRPLVLFGSGLCVIVIARIWLEEKLTFETPVVIVGAVLIATSHLLNLRLCQSCAVCTDDCPP